MASDDPYLVKDLSPEQRRLLAVVREEWLTVGVTTGPGDRAQALAGVNEAYRAVDFPPPRRVLWFDSPMVAALAVWRLALLPEMGEPRLSATIERPAWGYLRAEKQVWQWTYAEILSEALWWFHHRVGSLGKLVKDEVEQRLTTGDHAEAVRLLEVRMRERGATAKAKRVMRSWEMSWVLRDAELGQFDVNKLATTDLCGRLGLDCGPPPTGLATVARNASGWWPYRDTVVLTERPTELHRDEWGRLHNPDGPAVRYLDGFAVHAWHGIRVARRVITGEVTTAQWHAEQDAKVRAAIVDRMGYRWLLSHERKRKMHSTARGTLWQVDEPGADPSGYAISRSFVFPEDIWLIELPAPDHGGKRPLRRVPPDTPDVNAAIRWLEESAKDYQPPEPT